MLFIISCDSSQSTSSLPPPFLLVAPSSLLTLLFFLSLCHSFPTLLGFPELVSAASPSLNPTLAVPLTFQAGTVIPDEQFRPALSPSDFPALSNVEPLPSSEPVVSTSVAAPSAEMTSIANAERKAARKAAAAEKAAERARITEEKSVAKAVEKARLASEKEATRERERVAKLAKEEAAKDKAEKEKTRLKKERAAQEKEHLARLAREKQLQEEREMREAEKARERERAAAAKKVRQMTENKAAEKAASQQDGVVSVQDAQVPLLSKKPKKTKPVTKPIKVTREDSGSNQLDDSYTLPSTTASEAPPLPSVTHATATPSSNNSRAQSVEREGPVSLQELFEEIHIMNPNMELPTHPFFDLTKINPEADMPVEYAPLVHALSALSVGGTGGNGGSSSFSNNIPPGSMDNAVTNFQQLLETLTNTISDLLHLLPRTTWDDNSSFNGSLQDMMKGEESIDVVVAGEEGNREDDVAALTLALERRARWMETQLSKLEELHRDINTAAVRAVLSFNDHGWDRRGFLPHGQDGLKRFDEIPFVSGGKGAVFGSKELEKKLKVAKEAAGVAEAELRDVMERMQGVKPMEDF